MNFKTRTGKHLSLGNFYRLIKLPFYYGEFEYPATSGNWYKGVHTPIITKEVFQLVQEKLRIEYNFTYGSKEFAFTKMMTCGLCGSGICADEKFKKLKDGSVNRHIYYGCTKSRDKHCKCGYINEVDLIKQFEDMLDKINLNEVGIKDKIKEEVTRFKKFQKVLLNKTDQVKVENIDIRNYAKFILKDGTNEEKRELLGCFKSKITLKDKKVILST